MAKIFEIIRITDKDEKDEIAIRLGIRVRIAGHETICPISSTCNSLESLELEIQTIRDNLDSILNRTKDIFLGPALTETIPFESDMAPEKIWEILSNTSDEVLFIHSFNNLDEAKREEIAEYVLTRCNIFSGMASIFSARYNSASGLLE